MDYIIIKGYKSIRDIKIELRPINILIGSNGSGKSNFISFFEFLNRLYDQKLSEYIALSGGAEKILHKGSKVTERIYAKIRFAPNDYSFEIQKGESGFVFIGEWLGYDKNPVLNNPIDISNYYDEAVIKNHNLPRARYLQRYLNSFKKYHFHDTGKNSPFNRTSHVDNDSFFLYEKGENLASFLYKIQKEYPKVYQKIIGTIQSIAPYFSDFYFQPNSEGYLRLQWQDKYSSTIYGASDLSDGTIRFIALTTLFLQPNLPASIVIDEPELGLHPFAISKLAGMVQSVASRNVQVILATQSSDLVNHFQPEDIITVDQINGESSFSRLDSASFTEWMEEYSIGDLWLKNVIQGGQPR